MTRTPRGDVSGIGGGGLAIAAQPRRRFILFRSAVPDPLPRFLRHQLSPETRKSPHPIERQFQKAVSGSKNARLAWCAPTLAASPANGGFRECPGGAEREHDPSIASTPP